MQHIGLRRESESGTVLAEFRLEGIDTRIVERAPDSSVCLRFIDPYGDTIFNQLPALLDELRALHGGAAETDFRKNVERLIGFLEASIEIHTYVRFIGD
jgi:hypothetical protein